MKNIEIYEKKLRKTKIIKWLSIPISIAIICATFFITTAINKNYNDFASFLCIALIGMEVGLFIDCNKKIIKLEKKIYDIETMKEGIEDSKN